MGKKATSVQVTGLKELQSDLRRLDKALVRDLRAVNKSAAEVVAADARRDAPVASGRLRAAIKAKSQARSASVTAGSPARVPYAGTVHYGKRRRPQGGSNWPGRPFVVDSLKDNVRQVSRMYDKAVNKLTKLL